MGKSLGASFLWPTVYNELLHKRLISTARVTPVVKY